MGDLTNMTNWYKDVRVLVELNQLSNVHHIRRVITKNEYQSLRKNIIDGEESRVISAALLRLSESHKYVRKNINFYIRFRENKNYAAKEPVAFEFFCFLTVKENVLAYCVLRNLLSEKEQETFYELFSETMSNKERKRLEVDALYHLTMDSLEEEKKYGL